MTTSAVGEQDALRGYGYQYDHVAASAYDLYLEGRPFELRLVDPEVGAVDDCVLVLPATGGEQRGEVHAYQYKSEPGTLTLRDLLTGRPARGDRAPRPPLLMQLVDGWRRLVGKYPDHDVVVHLVSPARLSSHDQVVATAQSTISLGGGRVEPTGGTPLRPQHTARFIAEVVGPLASGHSLTAIDPRWSPVLAWIRTAAGVGEGELGSFLASLRVDDSQPPPLPPHDPGDVLGDRQRVEDIARIAEVLRRRVQTSTRGEAVVMSPVDVAGLVGFGTRGRQRHQHGFPVDVDLYVPLPNAAEDLVAAVDRTVSGYLAVTGPPGSGKSTLLAQVTPGLGDRVVTYLAFVPGDPANTAGRVSARDFLHDLVVALEASGLRGRASLPERDVGELRLRLRELLARAGQEYAETGRRTLVVVDGLDHVARASIPEPLLAELPAPADLAPGVVFVVGSQTLEPLAERIRYHLEQSTGTPARVVDLGTRRLPAAGVEEICQRLVRAHPRLRLSASHVARVVELSDGHPLAVGYLCNALLDLVRSPDLVTEVSSMGTAPESTRLPGDGDSNGDADDAVSVNSIDAVLDASVRYSGRVAEDYAAYLAAAEDSEALLELLGDLGRLRSPIDMRWVKTWGHAGLRELRRVRHLFRRLDDVTWAFFHDSFRQFVLERTSTDVLGLPDPAIDQARHAVLADRCAAALDGSRVHGEELYHSAHAARLDRVVILGTQQRLRARFLAGTTPSVLAEDIRLATTAAARLGEITVLVGLMLAQAELQARVTYLESVDVPGLLLDVGDVDGAVSYALTDQTLRVPVPQALAAAIRLDDAGHGAGRLLFDSADMYDLLDIGLKDRWETLRLWARCAVRFRPVSVLLTAARRIFDRVDALSGPATTARDVYREAENARVGLHILVDAAQELWAIGRGDDAERAAQALGDEAKDLAERADRRDAPEGWKHSQLPLEARDLVALLDLERCWFLAQDGKVAEALAALEGLLSKPDTLGDTTAAPQGTNLAHLGTPPPPPLQPTGQLSRARLMDGLEFAVQVAVETEHRLAAALATETATQPSEARPGEPAPTAAGPDTTQLKHLRDTAITQVERLLRALGPEQALPLADLSSVADPDQGIGAVAHRRRAHVILAVLQAGATSAPIAEEHLFAALPSVTPPPANRPAGANVAAGAALHDDDSAIRLAARLDAATSVLAVFDGAARTHALPESTLRRLLGRAISALPSVPSDWRRAHDVQPHRMRYLTMLIDAAATHSESLARRAGEALALLLYPPGGRRSAGSRRQFHSNECQQLALRLLQHGVRASWLERAIADADAAAAGNADAYERLDGLSSQIRAHMQAGDNHGARERVARLLPESFSVGWRKDYQLEEWAGWLLRAFGDEPARMLTEAADLAALFAALTDVTESGASRASATLLESVATKVPLAAPRLLAWQVSQGALDYEQGHVAQTSGLTQALLSSQAAGAQVSNTGALLVAVLVNLLLPVCSSAPTGALEQLAVLMEHLPVSDGIQLRGQLARAVDVLLLPSVRTEWRQLLGLPATAASGHDDDYDAAERSRARSSGRTDNGDSYSDYEPAHGPNVDRREVQAQVATLDDAFDWRDREATDSSFRWLPVLEPMLSDADGRSVERIGEAFADAYDAAAVLAAAAKRALVLNEAVLARRLARQALDRTEPNGWSGWYNQSVRLRAWEQIIACEGETARNEALLDLAQTLCSATYWAGMLMLDLDQILPVIAPDLPARTIWPQIRDYLNTMAEGLTRPVAPVWEARVHASWWAGPDTYPVPESTAPLARDQGSPPTKPESSGVQDSAQTATGVRDALLDTVFMHLDHPTRKVREGATALLAWLLRPDEPARAIVDARVAALLLDVGDRPVLAAGVSLHDLLNGSSPAPPTGTLQVGSAPPTTEDLSTLGIGGDGVRESAARGVCAAVAADPTVGASLASLDAAWRSLGWLPADCARQVDPRPSPPATPRPLPVFYDLAVARAPGVPSGPRTVTHITELGEETWPYGWRAAALAKAAGLPAYMLLHRLAQLAEIAASRVPDRAAVEQALTRTSVRHAFMPPKLQSLRAAYSRIVDEITSAYGMSHARRVAMAELLDLVDLRLVQQPFDSAPAWVPLPGASDWPRSEAWLDGTAARLSEYAARLTDAALLGDTKEESFVSLTSDLLGATDALRFGPVAAILGADHELVITDWNQHRETYRLGAVFLPHRHGQAKSSQTFVLPAQQVSLTIEEVDDWLMEDGSRLPAAGLVEATKSGIDGLPLIVAMRYSVALHTNVARWACFNPVVAALVGWQPHPRRPLCWCDMAGTVTAATVLWYRGPEDQAPPGHDAVGRGAAVLVTSAGLAALLAVGPLRRTHQVKRSFRPDSRGKVPGRTQTSAVNDLDILRL